MKIMTYIDDPGGRIPKSLVNWAATKGFASEMADSTRAGQMLEKECCSVSIVGGDGSYDKILCLTSPGIVAGLCVIGAPAASVRQSRSSRLPTVLYVYLERNILPVVSSCAWTAPSP